MNYYVIEGFIQNASLMTEDMMKEHMAYTQKAMDEGTILISSLKSDMSGAIFIMKAMTRDVIDDYLAHEPFGLHGVQNYKTTQFDAHYFYPSISEWFQG